MSEPGTDPRREIVAEVIHTMIDTAETFEEIADEVIKGIDATADFWPDGPLCKDISRAMATAYEAFDAAYYKSPSTEELLDNTARCSAALTRVRRLARENRRRHHAN